MRRNLARFLLFVSCFHIWLDWTRTVSVGQPLELLTLGRSFELFWPGARDAIDTALAHTLGASGSETTFGLIEPVPLAFYFATMGVVCWLLAPGAPARRRFVFVRS